MFVPLLMLANLFANTLISCSKIISTVSEKWSDTMPVEPYSQPNEKCITYLKENLKDFLQKMENHPRKVREPIIVICFRMGR